MLKRAHCNFWSLKYHGLFNSIDNYAHEDFYRSHRLFSRPFFFPVNDGTPCRYGQEFGMFESNKYVVGLAYWKTIDFTCRSFWASQYFESFNLYAWIPLSLDGINRERCSDRVKLWKVELILRIRCDAIKVYE